MKPLLPAIDAAGLLREAGFALLLCDHRPVKLADLASATGLEIEAARSAVTTLAGAGWLDLDGFGHVTGAAGLSLATGPHGLTVGAAHFRTWCAYDAIGISAALGVEALIETACGLCDAPISLAFRRGTPERDGPERLWLAEGGDDLRRSFCTPTVLLCSEDHGMAWADAHGGHGRLLNLVDSSILGKADWAGCADAARRLA